MIRLHDINTRTAPSAGALTYILDDAIPANGHGTSVELRRAGLAAAPPRRAWEELAAAVALEPSLTPFSAGTLRERWERGQAAVLVQESDAGDAYGGNYGEARAGDILAYTSVVPVFSAATRQALGPALGMGAEQLPHVDVYESMTGWTAPSLRKRGLSLHLRQPLLDRFTRADTLFIGFTLGIGASPVLSKLGWEVARWSEISFVGSIIENSTVDCNSGTGPQGWHVRGLKPYDGPVLKSFEDASEGGVHSWAAYCYFWVSDAILARQLDSELAILSADDVCRWRGLWGRVVESTLLDRGWVPIVLES